MIAIAITLLVLDVRVERAPGQNLAEALHHALPEIAAFGASFLQIGVISVDHHSLVRLIDRVDHLTLLLSLMLLACVSFLPLPTRLVAEYTRGGDGRTAVLLYGGTVTVNAVVFNLIWRHLKRAQLLVPGVSSDFRRDVNGERPPATRKPGAIARTPSLKSSNRAESPLSALPPTTHGLVGGCQSLAHLLSSVT